MKFKIASESENETKVVVKAGGFSMIIDEPENLGGTGQGANPVEYVLAALSGCLNVVGHIVAKEMNIKVGKISFEIEGELNPAKFVGKSDDERAGYKNINVKVIPETDADPEILKKWLIEMERRCPVSDNLQNETPVSIHL
ncbi:MAG TPA: OsmC family protein [Tepiditoga sp.]|nr:OsmC family protein [Tepiditoga sp.]